MPTSAKRKANKKAKSSSQRRAIRKRAAEREFKEANRTTLFSLPPELRNRVYLLVLPFESQIFRFSFGVHATIPALLQVNQQIRSEALGYYYGQTDFDLVVHHKHFSPVGMWAQSLGKDARARLLENKGINIRVVLDEFHTEHEKISSFLRTKTYFLYYVRTPGPTGWYGIATPMRMERAPLKEMTYFSDNRREAGFARKSDGYYAIECPARVPVPGNTHGHTATTAVVPTTLVAGQTGGAEAEMKRAQEHKEAARLIYRSIEGAMARLASALTS
ncbi:hypothetical protein LTR86_005014 [Recurvomyces mirabilis]|nr:hypothetical protein LTR86_005014 [Recurvomyces mirabilis]